MSKPENVKCETCVYWAELDDATGQCRRHAPRDATLMQQSDPDWACVDNETWCGDWSEEWPGAETPWYKLDSLTAGGTPLGSMRVVLLPESEAEQCDAVKDLIGAMREVRLVASGSGEMKSEFGPSAALEQIVCSVLKNADTLYPFRDVKV